MQYLLPAQGVGVFVYDKRGTGRSTGSYTQDFHLLAGDARAALVEALRLAGERAGRFGFHGGSQAGWVAPLAASKTPQAQFVLVGYGMATGPLAEDRSEEHTSELQSLMRNSYAVFCLKKKTQT